MKRISIENHLLEKAFKILQEFGREEDLSEWNKTQLELWIKLSDKGVVNMRDLEMFKIFGKFFYNFWNENHKIPTERDFQNYLI